MERKRTCSKVIHWRDHMRLGEKYRQSSLFTGRDASLLLVSSPNAKYRRELSQPVTPGAKGYELRGARSTPYDELLR
jgi:hypothetical protein